MPVPYHEGELEVQERAGVRLEASRIANMIVPYLPPVAQSFLRVQRLAVAGSIGSDGRIWASLLTGEPGFLHAINDETLAIRATLLPDDPLVDALQQRVPLGLLAIDLATRKRMRVNGQATIRNGEIVIRAEQVYFNCPKYIQSRRLTYSDQWEQPPRSTRIQQLSPQQQAWLQRIDTFFIASAHVQRGPDASHRGGMPGFVRVQDAKRLVFPDYPGNTMFQTLGNLVSDPRAGLLFIDFATGTTLQMTGKASVIWEEERIAAFAGAERLIEFVMEEGREVLGGSPLMGELVAYSPFNPV